MTMTKMMRSMSKSKQRRSLSKKKKKVNLSKLERKSMLLIIKNLLNLSNPRKKRRPAP